MTIPLPRSAVGGKGVELPPSRPLKSARIFVLGIPIHGPENER
jgi:hypothetical protein